MKAHWNNFRENIYGNGRGMKTIRKYDSYALNVAEFVLKGF